MYKSTHLVDQNVGELNIGVKTRRKLLDPLTQAHVALWPMEEPKNIV